MGLPARFLLMKDQYETTLINCAATVPSNPCPAERDDVLPIGQHDASDRDLVDLTDRFADDGEGVVANEVWRFR